MNIRREKLQRGNFREVIPSLQGFPFSCTN